MPGEILANFLQRVWTRYRNKTGGVSTAAAQLIPIPVWSNSMKLLANPCADI